MSFCWDGIPEECSRLALEADLAATKCHACGFYGHRVTECEAVPRCTHCHETGHRVSECPRVPVPASKRVEWWEGFWPENWRKS